MRFSRGRLSTSSLPSSAGMAPPTIEVLPPCGTIGARAAGAQPHHLGQFLGVGRADHRRRAAAVQPPPVLGIGGGIRVAVSRPRSPTTARMASSRAVAAAARCRAWGGSFARSQRSPGKRSDCGYAGSHGLLYLDDLSVGQRFVSGTHTMDAAEIKDSPRSTIRSRSIWTMRRRASTLFGGLVASGWNTAGTMMRLIVDGGLPIAGGIIGTGGELLWTTPVRPGDTLRVECEVLEITPSRSKPDRGMVRVRCITLNQHGEMVQSFTPKLVVPRRAKEEPRMKHGCTRMRPNAAPLPDRARPDRDQRSSVSMHFYFP